MVVIRPEMVKPNFDHFEKAVKEIKQQTQKQIPKEEKTENK